MTGAFTAAERRALETALQQRGSLLCPYCAVLLSAQPVSRSPEVSYVRRRVWVVCPQCRRTASLDERPGS